MILVKSSADEPMLVMSGKLNDHKSVWIPYLQEIEKVKPNNWRFIYNGGEVTLSLSAVQTIMFYGNSGTLPVDFLLAAAKSKTAIIVHSRNQDTPMILSPVTQPGKPDVLTEQIRFRENHRKKMVIAKALVNALRQRIPARHSTSGGSRRAAHH